MKTKKLTKLLVSILAISLLIAVGLFFFGKYDHLKLFFKKSNNLIPTPSSTAFAEDSRIGIPARVRIPSINIDAAIEQVGLTSDGVMDAPRGPANAGWFNLGAHPGEKGSAVLDGHFGWKDKVPAVFDNLFKLDRGEKIYIEDKNGTVVTFVVRGSKRYNPKADASDVFSSSDGGAHLNLITCEGVWNKVSESRPDRLVVFADKE